MRMSAYVFAAVLTAALPHAAAAQSQATTAAPASVPPGTDGKLFGTTLSHWTVAGFVGTNSASFGKVTTDPTATFGGQIGWLWRGVLGVEGIADVAPSLKVANNVGLFEDPRTSNFVGNIIAALPLGGDGQFQPYISGGWGYMQMHATVSNSFLFPQPAGSPIPVGTTVGDAHRMGNDIGGGFMVFHGLIGLRVDTRRYKGDGGTTVNATTPVGQFIEGKLTGIDYWRTNIGVALRW
jgi:hypothetical protein